MHFILHIYSEACVLKYLHTLMKLQKSENFESVETFFIVISNGASSFILL
jgi:hypothetical protein